MTPYVKFKAPYIPSLDFRVLQMFCIWQNIIKLSVSSWWMWLEMGNMMIDKDFEFQTWQAKFKATYLPSVDFRVLHMSCIWKNILKSSLPQWSIWFEMGNMMIDKDFEYQKWHSMWSLRLYIFLLLTSQSSRNIVFESIFLNHNYFNDQYDSKWGIGW